MFREFAGTGQKHVRLRSKLVEQVREGEPFIIAKADKPVAKVIALGAPSGDQIRRLGFMGQIAVPDDFDRMGSPEIARA